VNDIKLSIRGTKFMLEQATCICGTDISSTVEMTSPGYVDICCHGCKRVWRFKILGAKLHGLELLGRRMPDNKVPIASTNG
jgi:hypothetical protein